MAQCDTHQVTIKEVMARPIFQRGYTEAMCGQKFSKDYDKWSSADQWTYERGRQFYFAAGTTRLKQGRGVSKEAIRKYNDFRKSEVIL